MKRDPTEPNRSRFYDSSLSNRLSLLMEWYVVTDDAAFSDAAVLLVELRREPSEVGSGLAPLREG